MSHLLEGVFRPVGEPVDCARVDQAADYHVSHCYDHDGNFVLVIFISVYIVFVTLETCANGCESLIQPGTWRPRCAGSITQLQTSC